jgi:hypothetical protein
MHDIEWHQHAMYMCAHKPFAQTAAIHLTCKSACKSKFVQALQQAYRVLRNHRQRRAYDVGGLGATGLHVDVSVFERISEDGEHIVCQAHLPFDTAAFGDVHTVTVNRSGMCHKCHVRLTLACKSSELACSSLAIPLLRSQSVLSSSSLAAAHMQHRVTVRLLAFSHLCQCNQNGRMHAYAGNWRSMATRLDAVHHVRWQAPDQEASCC